MRSNTWWREPRLRAVSSQCRCSGQIAALRPWNLYNVISKRYPNTLETRFHRTELTHPGAQH